MDVEVATGPGNSSPTNSSTTPCQTNQDAHPPGCFAISPPFQSTGNNFVIYVR